MKNIKFYKSVIITLSFLSSLFLSLHSANAFDLCKEAGEEEAPITVLFFNGINNTEVEALDSLAAYRERVVGDEFNGEKVEYGLFYNITQGFIRDVSELFWMRDLDKDSLPKDISKYYELYWVDYTPWTENVNKVAGLSDFMEEVVKRRQEYIVNEYEKLLKEYVAANPESITLDVLPANLSLQKQKLYKYIEKGKKLLFVAHSQGNLFATHMYDLGSLHFKSLYPGLDPADSIKVVHVAPASKTLRGEYVLADNDLAILTLRGTSMSLIKDGLSPNVSIPLINCGIDTDVWAKHGFVETYLNPRLLEECSRKDKYQLPLAKVTELSIKALGNLKAPPVSQKKVGLFSVTLTMEEGPGMVALSVIEANPSFKNVHFNDLLGNYGTMSLTSVQKRDNKGNIVSHRVHSYKLNCDIKDMRGGVYNVGIAHYKNRSNDEDTFDKNKVSIKINTFDGEELFRSKLFGVPKPDIYESVFSAYHVLDIRLTWNFDKNKYDIGLEHVLDIRANE